MLNLTYDEYVELGGTLSASTFNKLIVKSRLFIDEVTFNRITDDIYTANTDVINYCMFDLVNFYNDAESVNIASNYSVDGVSVAYSVTKTTQEALTNTAFSIVKSYLSHIKIDDSYSIMYMGVV